MTQILSQTAFGTIKLINKIREFSHDRGIVDISKTRKLKDGRKVEDTGGESNSPP